MDGDAAGVTMQAMAVDGPEVTRSSPVVRSPADVLRAVVAAVSLAALLAVEVLFGSAVAGFVHDLLRGLDAFSDSFLTTVVVLVRVGAVGYLAVACLVAARRGRWRLLVTAALGAVAGAGVFAVADTVVDNSRAALTSLTDTLGPLTSTTFPTSTGLAAIAGVVAAASPWMARRRRRVAWLLVLGLAVGAFVAAPVSASVAVALASGWLGGAAAVVLLGAPALRPTRDAVVTGLRSVGLDLVTLVAASVDARGSTPYFGADGAGRRYFVKVLGRDERDADLLFRLYRFVVPRDLGDERPFSSLRRAVEHEALVALATGRLGVRTPAVVALCDAEPGGFVLAYDAVDGRSLDRVEPAELGPDVLHEIWTQLAILREHRVAHRDLRLANVFLDDAGHVLIIDFGFAELAASDLLLATDLAELVASLSLKVGPERAVASAAAAIGADTLRTALPRLRPGFLSGATRSGLAASDGLLDDLRAAVAGASDAVPVGAR